MNEYLERDERYVIGGRSGRAILAVIGMGLTGMGLEAQIESHTRATGKTKPSTQQFVLLFRQGAPRSMAERKRRSDEVIAWVRQQDSAGHHIVSHELADENRWIGPDVPGAPTRVPVVVASPDDVGALSNILFLQAHDLAEAVEIARTHPGLRYGASVEVRAGSPRGAAGPAESLAATPAR
jgi:hypothetical protein